MHVNARIISFNCLSSSISGSMGDRSLLCPASFSVSRSHSLCGWSCRPWCWLVEGWTKASKNLCWRWSMWSPRKVHKAMGPSFIRPILLGRQGKLVDNAMLHVHYIGFNSAAGYFGWRGCSHLLTHFSASACAPCNPSNNSVSHNVSACIFWMPKEFHVSQSTAWNKFQHPRRLQTCKSIRRLCINTLPDKNHMLTFCQWCGDDTQIHGLSIFTSHGQLVGQL